jgi:hypothetical protein
MVDAEKVRAYSQEFLNYSLQYNTFDVNRVIHFTMARKPLRNIKLLLKEMHLSMALFGEIGSSYLGAWTGLNESAFATEQVVKYIKHIAGGRT